MLNKIKKLDIGGIEYTVEFKDMSDAPFWGQHDRSYLNIKVTTTIPEEHQKIILIHEILHALFANAHLPTEDEELIVSALANGLYGVFKSNPKLKEMF